MPNPKLSVVIPTYKRAETLKQCLEHLSKQTVAKEMEVIVVSDGHDEKTAVLLDKYRVSGIEYQVSGESEWPFQIRFFWPIYLSVFFGFGLYTLFKFAIKK